MAIGIAEAIGHQGELRLPTRSVAASRSPLAALGNKGKGGTQRDLTGAIAQKLLTFSKPVLPGDEEQRTNNAVSLVSEMYQKQSSDPNYNPLSDPDFVKKFSDFRVSENRMQDLYRSVAADVEQRQVGGIKFFDNYDIADLTSDTGDKFKLAKERYVRGEKPFELDVRVQYPWTKAVGKEFKLENRDYAITQGNRNITVKGWDPKDKNADAESKEGIYNWLKSGSGTAQAALQTAAIELMDEAQQAGGQFNLTDPTNKEKVKERAYKMAYGEFLRQNELTTKDLKRGGFNITFGGGGAGKGSYEYKSGTYGFSSDALPSEFKQSQKNVNVVSFQPTGTSKKANLTDVNGSPINQAIISDLYFDENDNIIGGKAIWSYKGADIESYFNYTGSNRNQVNTILKDLDAAYQEYNPKAKKKLTEGATIKKETTDTRRFVPDFLNDAIKNIGDFLRPPGPQPPPEQGPDVTGMV